MSEKARKLFNELCERLNLKCPRCEAVFHDYDGCNALSCGVASCKAGFCAICLEDCGHDAHPHVRKAHGDYFDKAAFERSKSLRAKSEIDKLMASLSKESADLQQLVHNHIDKAQLLIGGADSSKRIPLEPAEGAVGGRAVGWAGERERIPQEPEEGPVGGRAGGWAGTSKMVLICIVIVGVVVVLSRDRFGVTWFEEQAGLLNAHSEIMFRKGLETPVPTPPSIRNRALQYLSHQTKNYWERFLRENRAGEEFWNSVVLCWEEFRILS